MPGDDVRKHFFRLGAKWALMYMRDNLTSCLRTIQRASMNSLLVYTAGFVVGYLHYHTAFKFSSSFCNKLTYIL